MLTVKSLRTDARERCGSCLTASYVLQAGEHVIQARMPFARVMSAPVRIRVE